ncbi:MAG: hypothetical protein ACI8TQ_002527 [Planctomycetota bacterium]|jgi:hypothetical protein
MNLRLTILIPALLLLGASDPPAPVVVSVPKVELGELRENRSHWLGEEVRFVFQLNAELKTWEPWITPFGVSDYRALSVWDDRALLWNAADYSNLTPRIFVRRGTDASKALSKIRRYDRFEVRAKVQTIFLDEPWIELLEVKLLKERVSQGTVLHAERAVKLIDEGHFELALGELDRARLGRLPKYVDAELGEMSFRCKERLQSK